MKKDPGLRNSGKVVPSPGTEEQRELRRTSALETRGGPGRGGQGSVLNLSPLPSLNHQMMLLIGCTQLGAEAREPE